LSQILYDLLSNLNVVIYFILFRMLSAHQSNMI